MKKVYQACLVVCAVFLQACAVFAPDARTPYEALPKEYVSGHQDSVDLLRHKRTTIALEKSSDSLDPVGTPTTQAWWTRFDNTELDTLVEMALGGSFDVLSARARLMQFEAIARKSGAELWPSLTGTAGADYFRNSVQASSRAPRLYDSSDRFALGAGVSYELDLWGRVYSLRESDVLRVIAGQEDVRSAAMTVAALTAETWLRLVSTRAETRLVESQVETNRIVLRSLVLRFRNALSTGLDVLQQQETLAASLAELPLLAAAESRLKTQLAILLGKAPGTEPEIITMDLPLLPSLPALGVPADLLEQRPDVRSAWYVLMAADWAVSAGEADRLPKITLAAEASYSGESAVVFSNWLTNLSAGLTAPLFDGGRRAAEVERLRGLVEENVQAYGKIVATAVGEVRDALINEVRQGEYLLRLNDQFRYASLARDEAREGYLNGRDDFLSFILEHKSAQSLERLVLSQRVELLRYRVALHRALGGDISLQPSLSTFADARVKPADALDTPSVADSIQPVNEL